jgi:hypothetical protein
MNIFESRAANPYNYTHKSFKWWILSSNSLWIYFCRKQQTLIITHWNHSNEGFGAPNLYEYLRVESSKPLQLHTEIIQTRDLELQILMNRFVSRAANPYNCTQKSFKWGIWSSKSLWIDLCREQQTLIITRRNHSNEGFETPNPYEYICVDSSKPL